jgi:hypothetical protein
MADPQTLTEFLIEQHGAAGADAIRDAVATRLLAPQVQA